MAGSEAEIRKQPPHILFDEIPDAHVRKRVEMLDGHAQQRPLLFLAILNSPKRSAKLLNPDHERRTESSTITPVRENPTTLLREYFMNDFDRWVEFDTMTEDLIATDETHVGLLAEVRTARNYVRKLGPMKSELRTNLEAPALRDQVRIHRFGLYIGQVAAFAAQDQPAARALPSAG
jgi:hypothetical protein